MEAFKVGLSRQELLSCEPLSISAAVNVNFHSSNGHHPSLKFVHGMQG
jgi:hypothetical protein